MVWAPSLSLAATQKIVLTFFSSGYLDVSVHRVPPHTLFIHVCVHALPACEFPHSDICGSTLARSSPQLFAACHVLLRRLVPRHPPYALCSLIFSLSKFPFRSLSFSRLLVSYKKILSTYFYSANSFSSVSVGFPFVSGFFAFTLFFPSVLTFSN